MSLVVPVSTSEDESVVLVPGVVGDTEEQPGTGDGVGTQLGGVRVVDVASRSSSLISHQPPAVEEVESEVRPSVLSVGGVVVVAREGTRNTTIYPSLISSYLVITSTTTYTS